jgi:transcriptional regulator with XRE-family HTH domain
MSQRSDVAAAIEERRQRGSWPTERSLIADFAIQVAMQLEQERERQGLTYEQLAEKAETSKAHVIRLLSGTYGGISNRSLAKLCQALRCEIDVKIHAVATAASRSEVHVAARPAGRAVPVAAFARTRRAGPSRAKLDRSRLTRSGSSR